MWCRLCLHNGRDQIRANHTATHLLHCALHKVLGPDAIQKGSLVDSQYLRFDFAYDKALTSKQLKDVEMIVNDHIVSAIDVETKIMNIEDAKKTGAMAIFGEKYDNEVRVLFIGDVSIELCGGTHVSNTSHIGSLRIVSEGSVASGIRRITAYTGKKAWEYSFKQSESINNVAKVLQTSTDDIEEKIEKNKDAYKKLEQKYAMLESSMIRMKAKALPSIRYNNIDVVLNKSDDEISMQNLRLYADEINKRFGQSILIMVTPSGNRFNFICSTQNTPLTAKQILAVLKDTLGAKGGGRDNLVTGVCTNVDDFYACADLIKGHLNSD